MKTERLFCIALVLILSVVCLFYITKKERIYILNSKDNNFIYRYLNSKNDYSDSLNLSEIQHIIIKERGYFFESWSLEIDQTNISQLKLKPSTFSKFITTSPDFIPMNFGRWNQKDFSNFKFYFVETRKDSIYILPVKRIIYAIE